MAKVTTIKDVIQDYQQKYPNVKLEEMKVVNFRLQYGKPAIEKLDSSIQVFKNCQRLSLSTNLIEKITAMQGLKNLKILSIGRNHLKTFAGLDPLSNTLEQLWISYNFIERTRGIDNLKKLKVLYIGYNNIKKWEEFDRFSNLPNLEDFLFIGNPLYETLDTVKYQKEVLKRMPNLKILEGVPIVGDDESDDE